MTGDYLGNPTWQPNGFVSQEDEAADYYANVTSNVRMRSLAYSYNVCFSNDPYVGDEHYGGDSFQYIPTEVEVGAAIAMRNMATAGELPVNTNDPGSAQLLKQLYQSTANFWQDIRNASGTGW